MSGTEHHLLVQLHSFGLVELVKLFDGCCTQEFVDFFQLGLGVAIRTLKLVTLKLLSNKRLPVVLDALLAKSMRARFQLVTSLERQIGFKADAAHFNPL